MIFKADTFYIIKEIDAFDEHQRLNKFLVYCLKIKFKIILMHKISHLK